MAGNLNVGTVTATSVNSGQLLENGVGVFGVGQTLQNVTASRAKNTTYTNSTGRAIFVWASISTGNGNWMSIFVNGANTGGVSVGAGQVILAAIVPNGATYSLSDISGSCTISTMYEMR